jgi:alginate O-acetyltransferase complex protein AlgI
MAIGLGAMLGFKFPENFKQPYRALSITDFWRRWHITLSSWMRDYLYIPLGGNRTGSEARLYTNLVIVFAVSGIWHGASWNFLLWGLFHGFFLILDRIFLKDLLGRFPAVFSRIITFSIVVVGWIFFVIEDFSTATEFLSIILHPSLLSSIDFIEVVDGLSAKQLFVLGASVLITSTAFYDRIKLPQNYPARMAALGVVLWLLSVSYLAGSDFNPFIYFRF